MNIDQSSNKNQVLAFAEEMNHLFEVRQSIKNISKHILTFEDEYPDTSTTKPKMYIYYRGFAETVIIDSLIMSTINVVRDLSYKFELVVIVVANPRALVEQLFITRNKFDLKFGIEVVKEIGPINKDVLCINWYYGDVNESILDLSHINVIVPRDLFVCSNFSETSKIAWVLGLRTITSDQNNIIGFPFLDTDVDLLEDIEPKNNDNLINLYKKVNDTLLPNSTFIRDDVQNMFDLFYKKYISEGAEIVSTTAFKEVSSRIKFYLFKLSDDVQYENWEYAFDWYMTYISSKGDDNLRHYLLVPNASKHLLVFLAKAKLAEKCRDIITYSGEDEVVTLHLRLTYKGTTVTISCIPILEKTNSDVYNFVRRYSDSYFLYDNFDNLIEGMSMGRIPIFINLNLENKCYLQYDIVEMFYLDPLVTSGNDEWMEHYAEASTIYMKPLKTSDYDHITRLGTNIEQYYGNYIRIAREKFDILNNIKILLLYKRGRVE